MPEYNGKERRKLKPEHEQLLSAVRETVERTVNDQLGGDFKIPNKQHFTDHELFQHCKENQDEMRANHEFVSGVRSTKKQMGKITVKIGYGGLLVFTVYAVWYYFKSLMMK